MFRRLLLCLPLLLDVKAACPAGTVYESSFNKCYKYTNEPATFLAAEENCQSLGGHLVTLTNAFENGYVSGIANALGSPTKYWIGANLLLSTSWSWISKVSFFFTNWAAGQPSDPSRQCGSVRTADNFWTAEVCNSALPFVCEIGANSTDAASQCASCKNAVCSDGYQLFPGTCRCYKYYNFSATNYKSGIAHCSDDNGAAAKITSVELNKFLMTLGPVVTGPWIGLQCSSSSNYSCYWPDGTNTLSYSNFGPGNPKGGLGTTYMVVDGSWWTDTNDSGSAVLCEKAPRNVEQILQEAKSHPVKTDKLKL